jgi:hypothetical protein
MAEQKKEDQSIEPPLRPFERPRSWGETIEPWSRIAAAVLIPAILGYYGSEINQSISQRSLEKDYVAVALEILTKPTEKTHPGLRAWAATIFAQYSPVQFDAATLAELASGDVLPPEASAVYGEARYGQAVYGAIARTVQLKLVLPSGSTAEVFLDRRRVDFSDGVAEVRAITDDVHTLFWFLSGPEGDRYSLTVIEQPEGATFLAAEGSFSDRPVVNYKRFNLQSRASDRMQKRHSKQ